MRIAKRVLLAEDEPHIAESLRFLLGREGFDVLVRDNGQDALATARTEGPDVMILDVMLPGMNGFEVLEAVRQDAADTSLPVIMLTAKGQREDRERARRAAVDLFISKPFSNAELVAAVRQLAYGPHAEAG